MKTILITGATGFLGRHLVERLRREEPDARLRLLCRSQSPWDGRPGIETMPGDVLSPEDVERAAAAGACGFLAKPFELAALRAVLAQLVPATDQDFELEVVVDEGAALAG